MKESRRGMLGSPLYTSQNRFLSVIAVHVDICCPMRYAGNIGPNAAAALQVDWLHALEQCLSCVCEVMSHCTGGVHAQKYAWGRE